MPCRRSTPTIPTTDEHLIEELGDLLYQIEFHATIAEQEGRFTIADVAAGIHDKLVRRHPHVFGRDVSGSRSTGTAVEVLANWDDIKREEKQRTSVFDGIPRSMPALAYAAKVGAKASKVGFDWPDVDGAFPKIVEETAELRDARSTTAMPPPRDELGDLLFAVVNVARHLDVDPELALRAATDKFRTRFEGVERLATERVHRPPRRRPGHPRRAVGRGQGRRPVRSCIGPGTDARVDAGGQWSSGGRRVRARERVGRRIRAASSPIRSANGASAGR